MTVVFAAIEIERPADVARSLSVDPDGLDMVPLRVDVRGVVEPPISGGCAGWARPLVEPDPGYAEVELALADGRPIELTYEERERAEDALWRAWERMEAAS